MKILLTCACFLFVPVAFGEAVDTASSTVDTRPPIAPDIRDDETELKFQRGNIVVVPIPISNPTLDTGLVVGAAYFYGQTAEQQAEQPASVTAAAGLYTSNDSRALVLGHQNYWSRNRWRFTGAVGAADLRLTLPVPDGEGSDWRIEGGFLFAKLARKVGGNWYGGLQIRAIDASQEFSLLESTPEFDTGSEVNSAGAGVLVEYDSRDMPINSYSGRYFILDALFNDESLGSDDTYQSYAAEYRAYHSLREDLVLAWELQACTRVGRAPLWDACMIQLRGFSVTEYLGKDSASGQAELRWQMSPRWGAVGFAGLGNVGHSRDDIGEHDAVSSYGVGLRFMVLPAKRVNLRLDYARSEDSDAIHVSVGEAF